MKILFHSNAPFTNTGYGVQCGHFVNHAGFDHDVAVSCTWGVSGAIMPWGKHKTKLYPQGYEVNGNDVIHSHALHHFDGDETGGWIIPLLDVWCLINPRLADFNVAAWTPIDHFPAPPDVVKFFHRTDAIPIAMSRFGERLLFDAGLDPVYIPLTVDTTVYKPTRTIAIGGREVTGRQLMRSDAYPDGIPDEAFVAGMVAMNKGWARDRKGFNEALRAFGVFWQAHNNAVLYMHCDAPGGLEGVDLRTLAANAGIPEHAIVWVDQYAYRTGFTSEMMAAVYSAMDVLLAPSHGEGFGVPFIEAQACGTPVITTDFSTGPELVGPGWLVTGQPEWDPAQKASYVVPFIGDVVAKLEDAYRADFRALAPRCVEFAAQYDTALIYETHWRPFLESLEKPPEVLPLEREPMGEIAVIVPAMRSENLPRLVESFTATNDGTAHLYVMHDDALKTLPGAVGIPTRQEHTGYAEKVNRGCNLTTEPWLLLVGDDVEFQPGWIEAARKLSDQFDVIGTNDTTGTVKNPDVANGSHADHFFVRRSYVDTYGACLDGPGALAPEAYQHWYVDKEIIGLAKARGVFAPCLDSVIVHHHPGYDGREDLRQADPTYMRAVEHGEADRKTWMSRVPLIQMQRTSRGKR